MTEETSQDQSLDTEAIKKNVDLFVENQLDKQAALEEENKRNNISLKQIISRSPPLPDDAVDLFFEGKETHDVPDEIVEEVKTVLKGMQESVNQLAPEKRFFILETINFFSSKISLGKLIPALLLLKGDDQKKAICQIAFPTFFSINKNIETLAARIDLFDREKLHMELGGLYTIVSDVSRILIRLFKKDLVNNVTKSLSTVEFLLTAFHPVSFQFNQVAKTESEFVFEEMIDDEVELRKIVLDFVVAIQSHEALYNYSFMRFKYYKRFLDSLVDEDRFQGMEPIDVSKILAGCLVANEQLKPDDELIEQMIDEDTFDSPETIKARRAFIDKLSPGNIYRLISRFRFSLQDLSKTNFGDEFLEVQRFSVKTILISVWTGFINLVEKGLSAASEPFVQVFNQIKGTYQSFVSEERKKESAIRSGMTSKGGAKIKLSRIIPKNLEAFAIMSQDIVLVETDIVAFRGADVGANQKDFGYTTRIFRKDQAIMIQFLSAFHKLFEVLKKDSKVQSISFNNQPKIREYYAAYAFEKYLVCLGLTHIETAKTVMINDKSIFPYLLLFREENQKKVKRILSREVVLDDQFKVYNEMPLTESTAIYFYEPLYLIFHLLPEKEWKSPDVQICLTFLVNELQRIMARRGSLIYCDDLPSIQK